MRKAVRLEENVAGRAVLVRSPGCVDAVAGEGMLFPWLFSNICEQLELRHGTFCWKGAAFRMEFLISWCKGGSDGACPALGSCS